MEQPKQPMKRVAASLGLVLALLWLVAVFGALSGQCGPAPTDQNPAGTVSPSPDH